MNEKEASLYFRFKLNELQILFQTNVFPNIKQTYKKCTMAICSSDVEVAKISNIAQPRGNRHKLENIQYFLNRPSEAICNVLKMENWCGKTIVDEGI